MAKSIKPIKTTADLREFLCETMQGVANGTVEVDTARNITKLAGQVNESIYAEAKLAKLALETNTPVQPFGSIVLGNN